MKHDCKYFKYREAPIKYDVIAEEILEKYSELKYDRFKCAPNRRNMIFSYLDKNGNRVEDKYAVQRYVNAVLKERALPYHTTCVTKLVLQFLKNTENV